MLPVERMQAMLDRLNRLEVVSIEQFARDLGVSRATVRRDIHTLERQQKLVRTRGGAMTPGWGTTYEPDFALKQGRNRPEKVRIAVAALGLVCPGDTVILDSGTTVLELAKLMGRLNATVVTNDLFIAMELAGHPGIRLLVVGGTLRPGVNITTGHFAAGMLAGIRADKTFLGTDGVDPEYGLMNSNTEEVPVKQAILAAARERILLCDHTKFGRAALVRVCQLGEINRIITGRELAAATVSQLREKGLIVETV